MNKKYNNKFIVNYINISSYCINYFINCFVIIISSINNSNNGNNSILIIFI